jgi:hypothetical protein
LRLDRHVHVAHALELVGERADVDRAQAAAGGELRDGGLGLVVVGGHEDVERVPATWPSTSVPAKVVLNA